MSLKKTSSCTKVDFTAKVVKMFRDFRVYQAKVELGCPVPFKRQNLGKFKTKLNALRSPYSTQPKTNIKNRAEAPNPKKPELKKKKLFTQNLI